jgi:hypothetical protein
MSSFIDGIALNNLFQEARTGGMRVYHCSHCGQQGHNLTRCNFTGAREVRQRRAQARLQSNVIQAPTAPTTAPTNQFQMNIFKVYNDNTYPIHVFAYIGEDPDKTMKFISTIPPYAYKSVRAGVRHHIVSIPTDELRTIWPRDSINIPVNIKLIDYPNMFLTGDTDVSQLNPSTREILFFKEYQVAKTELEKWKECGLKSIFLLKEIERLGGKSVGGGALEPIIDMVQDIVVPVHDELDKERAGVPSAFTNIT